MKKLQNNYTTPEQSKRLLELGVPAWTADCFYSESGKIEIKNTALDGLYPSCWSVGRLMEIYHICIPNTSIYGWSYHEDINGSYIDYIIQEYVNAYGELNFSKLEE